MINLADAQRSEIVAHAEQARDALKLIADLSVSNSSERDFAADLLLDVKRELWEIESRRRRITDPLNSALREVNDLFRPARDALDRCERVLKEKIAGFLQIQARINAEAVAAAAAAADGEEASRELARVEAPAMPTGMSVRKVWKFEIVDEDLVPREFCSPDPRKIGASNTREISGVRFFQEDIVAARRK